MNDCAETTCFICGASVHPAVYHGYRRCCQCGHETLATGQHQAVMINEELSENRIRRKNALDRFRLNLTRSVAKTHSFLLDVGSGSGGFLLHAGPLFSRSAGIEITPECVSFSRTTLGLDIKHSINDFSETVSVATFWHSLEHIPQQALSALLDGLHERCEADSRIIIAVPNAGSMLYRIIGPRFPYYDAPAHLHQFTAMSLQMLLSRHGFVINMHSASYIYSMGAYLQGFLNLFFPIRNFLYCSLRRGTTTRRGIVQTLLLGCNMTLCFFFIFPAMVLALGDSLWRSHAAVLTISAAPRETKDH